MRKLTLRNIAGAELVLTNSAPFLLQRFTEDEAVNIYNFKGMGQDGATYLNNSLDIKDINIEFNVIGKSREETLKLKSSITRTLNPKLGEGTLTYEDDIKERQIKCIVNKLPYFADVPNSEGRVLAGLISLTANNPYWSDLLETKEAIASWKGNFSFPLQLSASGTEIGYRELNLIANIFNKGDVECGMRIEFKADRTVVNPSLLNVYTGELIRINRTMVVGEKISITTHFGNKKILSTINGVTTNIFNDVDLLESTFLQLAPGDNVMRYDAEDGLTNLNVNIYYTPKYLGV